MLENKYYENVISEMNPFLEEQGFKLLENGNFANAKKEISVKYSQDRQMYLLLSADIDDNGKAGEMCEINAWLFDDSQNAKDAVSVGIDFVNSLRKDLGIKTKRAVNTDNIGLPTAGNSSNSDIGGFTKKMLDLFPALKNDYKEHVAVYGNFLYINFFGEKLVPQLVRLFTTGTQKQIKKFYDVYSDFYVKGDRSTVNVMIALLCAAGYENQVATEAIREMLKSDLHFLNSFNNFIPTFAANKKLRSALLK